MRVGTRGVPIEYYTLRVAGPAGSQSGAGGAIKAEHRNEAADETEAQITNGQAGNDGQLRNTNVP
ncbi:hypothetical protein NKI79_30550 [Mesorhizobium sp. M0340]|uniref:hypothetical protein n=1 Tax=Mesorhizobium sp. M0340 TaxID=2956939 RepID=UPI003338B970